MHAHRANLGPLVILHALAPGPIGGLERVVQTLAAGQRQAGHAVAVVAVLDAGEESHPFIDAIASTGVEVLPIRLPPRAYRQERRRLAQLISTLRPDVVHTHGYRADVQAGAVARGLGVRTVTTVHGITAGRWKNRLYEALQRRAFRRFDAVVAVARPLADRLIALGVPSGRVRVVPNGAPFSEPLLSRADARATLGLPAEVAVAGWVGRLSAEKGPDLFLEALALLSDRDLRAAVIGTGAERGRMEAQATRLGLAGRVHWCGALPAAGRLFQAFDCFVLSSRTEGTPIVLFEAMAAETPIVATAVGGVPDIVSGAEALLVPPDDPAALGAAVRAVLAEPGAARERAERARRRLESERSLAPWLARYEEVYRRVLTISSTYSR